ncbi:MAG TPA: malate synthase G, partial [Sinorhizobium sp.]|nr:malate synthase G [Sinorhizobium sp.]
MDRVEKYDLKIDAGLHRFLVEEAMPGTGVDPERFFSALSALIHDLTPKNRALLDKRDQLQAKLDAWYREHGALLDIGTYEA